MITEGYEVVNLVSAQKKTKGNFFNIKFVFFITHFIMIEVRL